MKIRKLACGHAIALHPKIRPHNYPKMCKRCIDEYTEYLETLAREEEDDDSKPDS